VIDPVIFITAGTVMAGCIAHLYARTASLERQRHRDAKAYASSVEGHAHELKALATRAIAAQETNADAQAIQAKVLQELSLSIRLMNALVGDRHA
jgi:outer membrane murein-binding lipoprotein Lpp